ncbi:MAG: PD-(D/E)XK nuclease family protein [Sulfuricaulis sp.]
MNADTAILVIPFGDDPLSHLAIRLLDRHRDQLPDLSQQIVLFPHASAVPRFRQILQEQAAQLGYPAIFPPRTGTLSSWACQFAGNNKRRLSVTAREILLLEILNGLPTWRRHYDAWPLINSLFALFDELSLYHCRLPDDPADFLQRLANQHNSAGDELSPFDNEARLVRVLWDTWREHLLKNNLQDQTLAMIDGLARSLEQLSAATQVYVAGFADFTHVELQWLKAMHAKCCLTLLVHGMSGDNHGGEINPVARLMRAMERTTAETIPQDNYTSFLERAYALAEGSLLDRTCQQTAVAPTSPVRGRLTIHEAADAESEARAIDVQVRRWLVQGLRDIGIVTNDRKLARRVRALLERANIGLQDAGGWALSTTSAATALARWMECLELNFTHGPLLDLLKSPFLPLVLGGEGLDRLVPAFEQCVVRARNITGGLDNYRAGLKRAHSGLARHFSPGITEALAQMLDRLEHAASGLIALMHDQPHPVGDFITALQDSLKHLGLFSGFENDDAGLELLIVLEEMRTAAVHGNLRQSWAAFHQWLRHNMEQRRFRPPMKGRGVELMGFAESRLYRFDALIIAGAQREHLPGKIKVSPYFNDNVRTELGLPSLAQHYALMFYDFRRLLEAAPRVVVSLRREHDGERVVPSPWVERLRAFHKLAYNESLNDPELEWLVQQPETMIVNREAPLPCPMYPPAAQLPAVLLPSLLTATEHQRLIDCPYQFFCVSGLDLGPEKEVSEEVDKADFGKYVHRILQAFHGGITGLPGPWRGPLDDKTLPDAEDLLREITQIVFADDMRRHFLTRGWLYRWQACIPEYLAWEQKYSTHWKIRATEVEKQRDIDQAGIHVSIIGRVDRLDEGEKGLRITDYKTGAIPTRELVYSGEKIQLPFYALLLENENIAQASFLSLQAGDVTEKVMLDGEMLATLRTAVYERLIILTQRLNNSAPLPAWGDAEACAVCNMEGLCRRGMWAGQKF